MQPVRMRTEYPTEPFSNADVAAYGITAQHLARAADRGKLRRIMRGVYAPTDWPDDLDHRAAAAAKVLGSGQVFIDRTASWLHGLDAFGFSERPMLPGVETAALTTRRASRADGVHGRSRDLAPNDVMEVRGVRLTTPTRTALDLACNLRKAEALACLDGFAREHGVGKGQLLAQLPRFRGRRGVIQARRLVLLMDPLAESPRESHLRLAVLDAGLPVPTLQFEVDLGDYVARLDLAYPENRVAIEYDGKEFHSSVEQREHDRVRRELLRSEGWTVIVVRSGDLAGARLDTWIREVRTALTGGYSTLRW
jgi:very-short-patch-repair endonuclease